MKEKTADEMFKRLGFDKTIQGDDLIRYFWKKRHILLEFVMETKNYYLLNEEYLYVKTTKRLDKAITKQMEELGWL